MKRTIQLFTALLAGFTYNLAFAEILLIDRDIPMAEGVFIPGKIQGKCDIGKDFADYLQKNIKKSGYTVKFADGSLRDRAATAEQASDANVRRAMTDLEVADIEIEAAEYDVQEAKTEAERSAAELRLAEAKVKKAGAELVLANAKKATENNPDGANATGTDNTKFLFVEIDQLDASTGGAWSGRKMVHVRGELRQGTDLIASFTGRRSSGGGVFGGYKGTCSIMQKNLKVIAEDIGRWIRSPRDNAGIGELE